MSPSSLLWYFSWGTTSLHSNEVLGFLPVFTVGSVASLDLLAQDGPASCSAIQGHSRSSPEPASLGSGPQVPGSPPSQATAQVWEGRPQGLASQGSQRGFLCPWLSLPPIQASLLELADGLHLTWTPFCSWKTA